MKRYFPIVFRIAAALVPFALLKPVNPFIIHQLGMSDNAKPVTAVVLAVGIVFAIVQMVKAYITLRMLSGDASSSVMMFHLNGLFKGLLLLWRERVRERIREIVHFGVWGIIIVLFSFQFAAVGTLDDWTKSVLFIRYFHSLHGDAMESMDPPPVVRLSYVTDDNNMETYYRDLAIMAKHLHEVGATVVIAPQPMSIVAHNLRRMSRQFNKHDTLSARYPRSGKDSSQHPLMELDYALRMIDSLGNVIMAHSALVNLPYQLYSGDSTVTVFSKRRIENSRMAAGYFDYPALVEWFPLKSIPIGRHTYSEIDVALLAAKRQLGIPDSVQPVMRDGVVVLGPLHIPIQPNGRALADWSTFQGQWLPVIAHHGIAAAAYDRASSDSLHYWSDVTFQWATIKTVEGHLFNDLQKFRQYFERKVVVVNWFNLSDLENAYPFGAIDVTNVIGSVLTGRFYERMPWLWNILLVLSVALTAFFVIALRATYAFWLSVLWSAMVSALGIWLFFAHHRMFEFLYIDVAILLSFLIFTLVKMSRAQNG